MKSMASLHLMIAKAYFEKNLMNLFNSFSNFSPQINFVIANLQNEDFPIPIMHELGFVICKQNWDTKVM